MVNNIPVNGWPQLKDLEAVQPTLDRLDKIESWKRTVKEETFTGDDITIENALALPARSLITEINAMQDLHGYDYPWAGGAGKNLLKVNDATYPEQNDVTLTVIKDSAGNITALNVNGLATGNCNFTIYGKGPGDDFSKIAGKSLKLYGGANCNNNIYVQGASTNGLWGADKTGSGSSAFTVEATEPNNWNVQIIVANGTNCNNVKIYPMLCSSNDSASFAPYSNECPISGRSSVVLTRSDGDEISEDFTIQLGTTVYGAEINWDTGVMTVKTKIEDMGNLTYNYNSANNVFGTALISDMADVDTSRVQVISSVLKGLPAKDLAGIVAADDNSIAFNSVSASKFMRIKCTTYTDGTAIKTAFTGQKICYELAAPTTIQLTPTMLEMLKGYNHIMLSDGYGTIELKALTGANWS